MPRGGMFGVSFNNARDDSLMIINSSHSAAGLLLAVMVLLAGCVNDPGPVGSGLIPGTDLLRGDTLVISASASRSITVIPDTVNSFSTVIAIGKSGSLDAWGLVQFSNFGPSFEGITVQTAELHMKAALHLGDSSGQFSLAVRRALADWTRSTFTYADLRKPGFYEDPPRSNFSPGTVSDTDDVALPLDTALVNSWFRSDTTNPNFGIVLEPTNSAVIKGFVTPQLVITYLPSGSTVVDTVTFAATIGSYRFVLGGVDTTAFQDSVQLVVHAGAASRAIVSFDISSLSATSAIHRALLEISADESLFDRPSSMRDSLMATFKDQDGFVSRFEAMSIATGAGTEKLYTFNITSFVQYWVQSVGLPEVGIRSLNERNGLEGFILHGSAAATGKKPRLRIFYSTTDQ